MIILESKLLKAFDQRVKNYGRGIFKQNNPSMPTFSEICIVVFLADNLKI